MTHQRTLAAVLLAVLLLPVSAAAAVTDLRDFSDYQEDQGGGVIQGHWAEASGDIQLLIGHNGIAGVADGKGGYKFEPDRSISTAELLSILLTVSGNAADPGDWPVHVMDKSFVLGIIPYSMLREGSRPITREKMAMVLVNAASILRREDTSDITYPSDKISDLGEAGLTYQPFIQKAYGMGLLAGTSDGYKPREKTTRAEACAIINRLFGYRQREDNSSLRKTVSVQSGGQSTQTATQGSGSTTAGTGTKSASGTAAKSDSGTTSGTGTRTQSSSSGSSRSTSVPSVPSVPSVSPAKPAAPAKPAVPGASASGNTRPADKGSASKRPFFPERPNGLT